MQNYICTTCGVQYDATEFPPDHCVICEDDRQYVKWEGQQWATMGELRFSYSNVLKPEAPGLIGIGTEPGFAIGQRALLMQAPAGNVLWDAISLIDDATVQAIRELGGIAAIAISHPHFYASMVEWSYAFGDVPIYLHAADRQWVMRPDTRIEFWEGETRQIAQGMTLVRCGGHFPGGTVLHWARGNEGKGALLSGDIIQVAMDRRSVSFMCSYPNYIPLDAQAVRQIAAAVEPFRFDAIYGAWFGRNVASGAKAVLARSTERYLRAIGATAPITRTAG